MIGNLPFYFFAKNDKLWKPNTMQHLPAALVREIADMCDDVVDINTLNKTTMSLPPRDDYMAYILSHRNDVDIMYTSTTAIAKSGNRYYIEKLLGQDKRSYEYIPRSRFAYLDSRIRVIDVLLFYLAEKGDLETIKWIDTVITDPHIRDNMYSENLVAVVARKGHLDMLKWLFDKNCVYNIAYVEAAYYGNLEMVEWLVENGDSISRDIIVKYAVMGGRTDMLGCMMEKYGIIRCSKDAVENGAAQNGNIDIVKFVYENGMNDLSDCYLWRYFVHDVNALEYLNSINHPRYNMDGCSCFNLAVSEGRIDALKWFKENGFEGDTETYCHCPSVEMLEYLWSERCPYDISDNSYCYYAVFNDSIPMLEWYIEKGFLLEQSAYCAVKSSEMLRYLHGQGISVSKKTDIYSHFVKEEDFGTVKYINEVMDVPPRLWLMDIGSVRDGEILEYLYKHCIQPTESDEESSIYTDIPDDCYVDDYSGSCEYSCSYSESDS